MGLMKAAGYTVGVGAALGVGIYGVPRMVHAATTEEQVPKRLRDTDAFDALEPTKLDGDDLAFTLKELEKNGDVDRINGPKLRALYDSISGFEFDEPSEALKGRAIVAAYRAGDDLTKGSQHDPLGAAGSTAMDALTDIERKTKLHRQAAIRLASDIVRAGIEVDDEQIAVAYGDVTRSIRTTNHDAAARQTFDSLRKLPQTDEYGNPIE